MSFVAVAIGGAGLVSGGLGYLGAKEAANTQANSAQQALQFQQQAYAANQPRFEAASSAFNNAQGVANNSFQPWITSGQGANVTLSNLLGNNTNNKPDYSSFYNSPDYQFAQQQGQRGAINAANAQGVGLSGGTLKDLSEFNSGLASQQYGNYFSRLMSLSQMGATAAGGLSNATTNIAGGMGNLATGAANANNTGAAGIGNTYQGIGQAQASGIVGGTNAITGGINNGVSNSLLYNSLNRSNPSAYQSASGPTSVGGPNGPTPLHY